MHTHDCIHCGKPLKNRQALRAHLAACLKRELIRSFRVQGYVFELTMNPKRRYLRALNRIAEEYNDPLIYPDGIRLFSAVVVFLKEADIVKSWKVILPE